jgi:hypothetical protein
MLNKQSNAKIERNGRHSVNCLLFKLYKYVVL